MYLIVPEADDTEYVAELIASCREVRTYFSVYVESETTLLNRIMARENSIQVLTVIV